MGLLSWTFNVPGLWSLHRGFVHLSAAKPFSAGPLSHPEHYCIPTDLTGTAKFSTTHLCSKATQHVQVVSLELNFQFLGCSNIHLLVRGILQSRIPHLLLTICLLEIGVFQTVS